ncbi:CPBP family intramembrane glutamic endopeptidase [Acanthopleuribacter pedis]|uniref:CPBP family intramembrane metalloprotease n=1 Tax=Acanthopleuribacter pedis TaxID=442870 RepID=A0A8J7Q3M4_9BACT|nr:CPBP family intramembrane glutamic endopeptidase [Acanthopleuribacter pedis]MBO1319957.1 CPBP family intramembrane metalloprotease [Acanthopleuribacter pedis]
MRLYLIVEFIALFWLLPLLYVLGYLPLPVIPTLLLVTVVCCVILFCDKEFDRTRLWRAGALSKVLLPLFGFFAIGALALAALVYLREPDRLFDLPYHKPAIYLSILCLYPIISVYPQELVYRAFFFRRYEPIFPRERMLVWMSALAFGWMHIVFENVLAVALTLIGGFLFSRTYLRTRSLFCVGLEHSLYGCFIFTIGLGRYFFSGTL